ncbi:MAG: tail fiber protein [Bacteroidetes bacterium]|nr:tail fiber protein [Bacteroidota bacterium]
MDEYMGIIKLFAGNFAPRGWAFCAGQTLAISSNTALFSILGTTYGGNGTTTFCLPDLRGRVPVGVTNSGGSPLSTYTLGEVTGTESNTILVNNLPPHTHTAALSVSNADSSQTAATAGASIATPGSGSGRAFTATLGFNTTAPNTQLAATSITVGATGSGIPVNNIQPVLALNYIICTEGVYPSRN